MPLMSYELFIIILHSPSVERASLRSEINVSRLRSTLNYFTLGTRVLRSEICLVSLVIYIKIASKIPNLYNRKLGNPGKTESV